MRVLHTIPSLSPRDGGPSFALPVIAGGLHRAGIQVDVAVTDDDGRGGHLDVSLDRPVNRDGVNYFYFRRQSRFYKTSWSMTGWLSRHIRQYDLVHIHALFSYSSTVAAFLAMKNHIPYVVRPLGVLNRWGMQNRRRGLKQLSFRLIERHILDNAAAVHYTSQQERLEAEEAGATSRPSVIPLGIDLSEFEQMPGPGSFYRKFPEAVDRDIILFLSRLDAKKGLDLLLRAFAEIQDQCPQALLVIAGSGEEAFVAGLRQLAEALKVADKIIWAGFLSGEEKLSAFRAATLFALPSYSENFGIAVVEALAAGLPCVVSDQVGIASDISEFEAGQVVPCQAAPLALALRSLLTEPDLRRALALRACRLARHRFSEESMVRALTGLYGQVALRPAVAVEG